VVFSLESQEFSTGFKGTVFNWSLPVDHMPLSVATGRPKIPRGGQNGYNETSVYRTFEWGGPLQLHVGHHIEVLEGVLQTTAESRSVTLAYKDRDAEREFEKAFYADAGEVLRASLLLFAVGTASISFFAPCLVWVACPYTTTVPFALVCILVLRFIPSATDTARAAVGTAVGVAICLSLFTCVFGAMSGGETSLAQVLLVLQFIFQGCKLRWVVNDAVTLLFFSAVPAPH
jgi:hypothetical protein